MTHDERPKEAWYTGVHLQYILPSLNAQWQNWCCPQSSPRHQHPVEVGEYTTVIQLSGYRHLFLIADVGLVAGSGIGNDECTLGFGGSNRPLNSTFEKIDVNLRRTDYNSDSV